MHNHLLLKELIAHFDINLDGLNVYTEAASGHYAYGPVLAAYAGAKHVTAQVRDSRFGLAKDIIENTNKIARAYNFADKIKCVDRRSHSDLAKADIVTNSGHVRPIDHDLIDILKSTAVIPLMWETWELRDSDFDLDRCREREILVLGTNERTPACDMRPSIGMIGLKLLLDLGYDGGSVLVLGNSPIPGATLVETFRQLEFKVTWVSDDPDANVQYENLSEHFHVKGKEYTHIIIAEHQNSSLLIGSNGLLDFEEIKLINPNINIGVMCGNIEADGLRKSGLSFLPKVILPHGFVSYQLSELGPRPVLKLFAAGLKVGERMSRARLGGQTLEEAAITAIKESPAMLFTE